MPGVDLKELRRHCYAAFRQTLIRDGAALAVLVTAAIMAPAGTAFVLGLIAIVARFRSRLVLVSAALLVIALLFSRTAGSVRLLPALIAIGACFLFYAADNFWARQRVRGLLRDPAKRLAGPADPGQAEGKATNQNGHDSSGQPGTFRSSFDSQSRYGVNGKSQNSVSMSASKPIKVFYEKERIVGTGNPWQTSTLTIAVDKPAVDKDAIIPFRAIDLIAYILAHLRAQGAVTQSASGLAYRQILVGDKWLPLDIPQPTADGKASDSGQHFTEFESFTHGLPDLDVREVIAVPVPRVKLVPVWWFFVRHVIPQLLGHRADDQTQLSDLEFQSFAQRPPTAAPERHYVRASATTWDGQVVISVYVSAVLQAHYLRVLVRPYELAPAGPELKQAGELAQKSLAARAGGAIYATFRQARLTADWLHEKGRRRKDGWQGNGRKRRKRTAPKLSSARESYALAYTDNLHHIEDADRMIDVMVLKIFSVTREYLKDHNVDLEDYDKQVQVFINSTVIGDIKNSGNLAIGERNKQQQGGKQQQGSPGGSNKEPNGSK